MSTNAGRPRSAAADEAIAVATLRSLLANGFSGTTMAGIARSAGVSTATLYRRFATLEDTVASSLARFASQRVQPDTGSLRGDLTECLSMLASELSGEYGQLFPALIEAGHCNPKLRDAMLVNVTEPQRAELARILERAAARGELRDGLDTDIVIDMAYGAIAIRRLENVRPMRATEVRHLVDLVLAAVGPPTARSVDPRSRSAGRRAARLRATTS